MYRIAITREEKREAARYWQEMRAEAARIRDAYDRECEHRRRTKVRGTRAHVDAMVLYL